MKLTAFILALFIGGCTLTTSPKIEQNYDSKLILENTIGLVKDNYPYISFKRLNIDSLHAYYLSNISAYSGDEVFSLLKNLLGNLKDGHVYIKMPSGVNLKTFVPLRSVKDQYSFSLELVKSYLKQNEITSAANGRILYGFADSDIGYIYISTFINDGTGWYSSFSDALEHLKNCRAIILDVRHNGGGSDLVTNYIISRFINKPFIGSQWLDAKGVPLQRGYYNPAGSYYGSPVVLLQNGVCFSSAEGFINTMRELDQVTTMGDTTGGGSSNPGEFDAGFNIKIIISRMMQLNYQGQPIEWNGLVPDVLVPQGKNDLENMHDKQLEEAIRFLRNK